MTGATETSPSQKSDDLKGASAPFFGNFGSEDGSRVVDSLTQETATEETYAERSVVADETGVPLLPPPDPNSGDSVPKIKLGETISFEEMGPVIINADGTTRRIDNWDQMTEGERQVAWRRISKRNEERRRKLLLLEQQKQQNEVIDVRKDGAN